MLLDRLRQLQQPHLSRERRPAGLIYGRNDRPPLGELVVLGLQHAVESASKVTLPTAVLLAVGATAAQMESMIVATLIISGIATILIAGRRPLLGFGHLLPVAILSSFVAPASLAAQKGGLPLVAGMTLITGAIVALLSRVLHRARALFPPEVVGLIAFMVGASQASLAVSRFLGVNRANEMSGPTHLLIAAATLSVLAGLTVWGKGAVRLFSSIVTLVFGYLLSAAAGMLGAEQWARVREAPLIDFPRVQPPGFQFDATLILPFVVLGISAAMKAAGDITIAEKISDADWKRADLRNGRAAMFTLSLSTMLSSALGGFALMSSSSNVGLSAATGATSRFVGYSCGALLIALACFPKVVALIAAVPPPVVGAMFLLVVSYNLIAGMQIIMSRMMEARHTYIIGLSLLFGLSAEATPMAYRSLPDWLRPLFASGLTVATTMVVLLNAIFRLGARQRESIDIALDPGETQRIYQFVEEFGATWGARKEVVERAVSATVEVFEVLLMSEVVRGNLKLQTFFDEFRFDVVLRYRGIPLDLTSRAPGEVNLLEDDNAAMSISSLMLRHLTDNLRTRHTGDACEVEIQFEH